MRISHSVDRTVVYELSGQPSLLSALLSLLHEVYICVNIVDRGLNILSTERSEKLLVGEFKYERRGW
jgi:hypothetical protein